VGTDLQDTVASNRSSILTTTRNLESASAHAKDLLGDLHAGRGLAGALLRDEGMANNFKLLAAELPAIGGQINHAVSNVNSLSLDAHWVLTNLNNFLGDGRLVASNGAILISNLNAHGLLYKPKPPKPAGSAPTQPLLTPRMKSLSR